MKDEFCRKIIVKFVRLIPKMCSYLIDDGVKNKKGKSTKKCFIKRKLKFKNHKNCLEVKLENKVNYVEKNKIDIDSL